MRCYIGIGSNIENRRVNLEKAVTAITRLPFNPATRVSPVYETPALLPEGAPPDWESHYLNAVVEIEWNASAQELMQILKRIEKELGRSEAPRWAPRIIDLDLLFFGSEVIDENSLRVPHPGILHRSFVLDPLKDLAPRLCLPKSKNPAVIQARILKTHSPWIMGILNVTPNSFSDGGETETIDAIERKIKRMDGLGIHAIDVGAESTRPGATEVTSEEEHRRLEPVLDFLKHRYRNQWIRPRISVDTRRAAIAEFAIQQGADCINDVSGFADPEMLDLLKDHSCDYVLTHSLGVPANPRVTLMPDCDPIHELKNWLSAKLEWIESNGINLDRIIFDPGIGFGKTSNQSLSILRRMDEFADLPVRVLVGHSRKSFMKEIVAGDVKNRDTATLTMSLDLANQGVDILRVHDYESHLSAFKNKAKVLQ